MITQPQLLDITNTITSFTERIPTLFTNATQDVVTSVLWNVELDDEGHTLLGIVIDPHNGSLILTETEGNTFCLNTRYTIAGIATLNNLSFNIEEMDECVACELGSRSESEEVGTTEASSTLSNDTPVIH
jgi:hypothetical protein